MCGAFFVVVVVVVVVLALSLSLHGNPENTTRHFDRGDLIAQ